MSIMLHVAPPNIAHVSIDGVGVKHFGTASLDDAYNLKFDESFESFLKRKRVSVSKIMNANEEKISIVVKIPLGRTTINLFREKRAND